MKAEKFTLSNGLDVVYLHLPNSFEFRLMLDVPVGGMHDPAGKEGLSHVREHLSFCGTESSSEDELKGKIDRAAGTLNAATAEDDMTYDFSASSDNPDNFFLLADTMREVVTEPAFDPNRVEIEKKVIFNEIYDDKDTLERGSLLELEEAMHGEPHSFPDVIGTEETISSITSDDLKASIQQYNARHMTAYAVGSLGFDDAMGVLENTLSGIPSRDEPEGVRYKISCIPRNVRKERGDLNQNYTTMMFVTPDANNLREQIIRSEVMEHLNVLIKRGLRKEKGCLYNAVFDSYNFDGNTFMSYLHMSNRPADSETAFLELIEFKKNIDKIITDDIIYAELKKEQRSFSFPDRLEIDALDSVRYQYKKFGTFFNPKERADIFGSITPEEVRAQAHLILSSLKGLYVQGPEPLLPPSLEFMQERLSVVHDPAPTQKPAAAVAYNI